MTRILQGLILTAGLAVGAVMIVLGLWQMGVYQRQGEQATLDLAAEPALSLASIAPPSQPVREGFSRTVTFTGEYIGRGQLLVPVAGTDRYRVLTPLIRSDGAAVPVVRGVVTGPRAPAPPTGQVSGVGVLAPSESGDSTTTLPAGQIQAVQLSELAQTWPWPLTGGYVTLPSPAAQAQGLGPAAATLPTSDGRLRNGVYALQWWVFAAFAVGMSIKMAHDLGRHRELEEAELAQVEAGRTAAAEVEHATYAD